MAEEQAAEEVEEITTEPAVVNVAHLMAYVDEQREEGNAAFKKKRHAEALAAWQRALDACAQADGKPMLVEDVQTVLRVSSVLHSNRGQALIEQEWWRRAVKELSEAVRIDPTRQPRTAHTPATSSLRAANKTRLAPPTSRTPAHPTSPRSCRSRSDRTLTLTLNPSPNPIPNQVRIDPSNAKALWRRYRCHRHLAGQVREESDLAEAKVLWAAAQADLEALNAPELQEAAGPLLAGAGLGPEQLEQALEEIREKRAAIERELAATFEERVEEEAHKGIEQLRERFEEVTRRNGLHGNKELSAEIADLMTREGGDKSVQFVANVYQIDEDDAAIMCASR